MRHTHRGHHEEGKDYAKTPITGASMRHSHRGHHEEAREYAKTPVTIDHNYVMAEFVGPANGLQEAELAELGPRLRDLDEQIKAGRAGGDLGFLDLPYDQETLKEIKEQARHLKDWCRDVLVLGLGGSALGVRALRLALCHPSHNQFPIGRRHYQCRLFVADHIDPDSLYGLLDDLELKRLLVNVISKSGDTPETLAKFLFVYDLLKGRLGESQARESCLFTTDPDRGGLRRLAVDAGFPSLSLPVAERFAVFSAASLLPAAMAGIDIAGLLAGARFMDQRLQAAPLSENMAYRLAACYYLAFKQKGLSMHVLMPYAASLAGVADWFCHVWARSLTTRSAADGSVVVTGPAPRRAMGVTEENSFGRLFLAGPADELITFLEVEKFTQNLSIPASSPEIDSLQYLGGQTLASLLRVEKQATAFSLMKAGRPNLTIKLPEINAFTIGQLMYLCEVTVVALAGLLNVNPLDSPGVEDRDKTMYGLLGRPGYDIQRAELENAPSPLEKYLVS